LIHKNNKTKKEDEKKVDYGKEVDEAEFSASMDRFFVCLFPEAVCFNGFFSTFLLFFVG
jgi:hypothetical protein